MSSPSHSKYGKYLTAEKVGALIRPDEASLVLVTEWLAENGVEESALTYSANRDWIFVTLPIDRVESLLLTEYHIFRDELGDSASIPVRASQWSLPDHLHAHIDCIQPTTSFFGTSAGAQRPMGPDHVEPENAGEHGDLSTRNNPIDPGPGHAQSVWEACNATDVTPTCIRTLYGALDYEIQSADQNSMALTNFLGEFNNISDTTLWVSKHRPDIPPGAWNFTDISVAGGENPQTPATAWQLEKQKGLEGSLDLQAMLGIAWPTPLTIYSTLGEPPPFIPTAFAPNNTNEPYLIWLDYMLALPDDQLPKVVSNSYGDVEHTLPIAYARRVCNAFAQLGARGVSVLSGSGDSGVGRDGMCQTNRHDGRPETAEFLASFPDACPYVTSVGATMHVAPEEVAVNDAKQFVSGGGFSNYFARPAWQQGDGVVDAYIAGLGALHRGMYNPAGAAYPDVSAQGYEYSVVWNGTFRNVGGTSASAPTFAAVVALLNDALLAEGKPVLGFLNPWLWEVGRRGQGGFTDVVVGSNHGCNGTGFPAKSGWDAASGWGTPVRPGMIRSLELQFMSC